MISELISGQETSVIGHPSSVIGHRSSVIRHRSSSGVEMTRLIARNTKTKMKTTINIFLFLTLFLSSFVLQAQMKPLENSKEWLNKISEHTAQTENLQADFVQEKVLSFLETPVISKGKFWFQQPEKIRWEYQDPYLYTMIMNEGILTVKDEGDEYSTDLSSNKMFEQMNGLIAGSIQGKLLEEDQNYQKEYFSSESEILVRFMPNSSDLKAYLQHIEIYFDKKSLEVNTLVMTEPSGDFTKIQFSNRKINQEISADVFH